MKDFRDFVYQPENDAWDKLCSGGYSLNTDKMANVFISVFTILELSAFFTDSIFLTWLLLDYCLLSIDLGCFEVLCLQTIPLLPADEGNTFPIP
ncbi:hypothetical protein [Streptococcus ovuberis]|uniref:Uncharacterized protein n=1 Tax=Streptococcus ovuberis TaxID=1936207 RepID=A0A7X6N149_9STRE|nr:hypothetical protein [Streptococcus ovuberis]NKZ20139.1 hypothetical protein [Streptococcus ovuberis]